MEGADDIEDVEPRLAASYGMILAQIAVIDIVFSLNSVITAVGMALNFLILVSVRRWFRVLCIPSASGYIVRTLRARTLP